MSDIISLSPRFDAIRWIEHLSLTLSKYRFSFSHEKDLQAGIRTAFAVMGGEFISEHRLSDSDIVDFYWPEQKVAVEVKIDHSLSDLTRQIHRYVQHDSVHGLLLVTSKTRLTNLPEDINRKPVRSHNLLGSLL